MTDVSGAAAPALPGLTFVKLLGRGGFADVYLYEQDRPRMRVAVKVLRAEGLTDEAREKFAAEANAMAELAGHPYIVQVFRSDVTEDGRPYMVMKYYPQRNLAVRARSERIPVPEVLQIGVRIASAVETAHRAGITHRDIKPANILTSQYGEPGLTDFGIATTLGEQGGEEADGMSVPWSPPEILFGHSQGDRASDVYSLGATLWHLLTGRSPFEAPGGDNSTVALMSRIKEQPPPRTGREDVPASLERTLAQAMAKNPADRPDSALQLARSLQSVEAEQRWALTQLVVLTDEPLQEEDEQPVTAPEEGPATRLKQPQQVIAQPPAPRARQMPSTPKAEPTVRRPVRVDTSPPVAPPVEEEDKGSPRWLLAVAAAVVVAIVVVVGVVLSGGGKKGATTTTTQAGPVPTAVVPTSDTPTVTATRPSADTVRYSWTDPGAQPGDSFVLSLTGSSGPYQNNGPKTFLVARASGSAHCIWVEIVRQGAAGPPGSNC